MIRVAFAGTPPFAAAALESLLEAGYPVPLVLTQPDRPAGRGMKPVESAVKQLALQRGLRVFQPLTLKDAQAQAEIAVTAPDVLVVAAYGLILPQAVLTLPRLGCLNIHASLLPRWRGAAPIQRAILAGDRETGITLMQMDEGLDTGAMLSATAEPIREDDTAQTLHDRLAALGATCIVQALDNLAQGTLTAVPQDASAATYAAKLAKAEARLDWKRPAVELARAVRAYNPFPVAQAVFGGEIWRIWAAHAETGNAAPGEILCADKTGILVGCGAGTLRLTELQKAGGKRLSAAVFLAGNPVTVGERFEC